MWMADTLNMSNALKSFMSTRGYGVLILNNRELGYVRRTFQPQNNGNAPSQVWVGHFTANRIAFSLQGSFLKRVGEVA